MPSALLKDRTVILVSGPDAEHFLQNILTTDLDGLAPGEARPGALLTPQGKILFDFLISHAGDNTFRLDCRADVADDFIRRLMLYRLRAKADISKQEQVFVSVEWDDDSSASQSDSISVIDGRFADGSVRRRYGQQAGDGDIGAWHALRIASGVAESGSDYQLGDAFPHDILLDQAGGIGFQKGCYVGQEVVSRMQHRGTARRRVLLVLADGPLPLPCTELTVDGRGVGTLGSSAGRNGLAIARIDRVKAAMDERKEILAGDVAVSLSIPDWATFRFPEQAGAEEA
ncbi:MULTISPECIES: CAF17-like 4Fe-4S cluster assembly/insertion protein YgfZ [Phyllobacteriaceae]|uniref:Folate-binding protein YgfZ n=1 Tax=Ollibium composti TaxID=2675109 RepID=A0ABY2Q5P0_9HYPH|nr:MULTISPECIES: folate-binding protein YgfZ [Mesorhizobium]QDB98951.1 folate-binding protein YgfZ [Mesorhizobium sp. 8]THF56734.1 folate-binding protein YgfZ [Mesorhizobium composti]